MIWSKRIIKIGNGTKFLICTQRIIRPQGIYINNCIQKQYILITFIQKISSNFIIFKQLCGLFSFAKNSGICDKASKRGFWAFGSYF